uniref:Sushi domain-containing protein n=1 Tax=Athene cunicularia TaxID=194338 RepID=A0A663MDK8_ATHCN
LRPPRRSLRAVHGLRELEPPVPTLHRWGRQLPQLPLIAPFLPVFSFLIGGCGTPPNLAFAELSKEYKNLTEFAVGATVRYSCQLGYMRHPGIPPTLTCLKNHTWSEALAFCKIGHHHNCQIKSLKLKSGISLK